VPNVCKPKLFALRSKSPLRSDKLSRYIVPCAKTFNQTDVVVAVKLTINVCHVAEAVILPPPSVAPPLAQAVLRLILVS
jgi:hypothetical protein